MLKLLKVFPFSSLKKRMSTIVRLDDGKFRLYVKGAPEFLLPLCTSELVNDKAEVLTEDRKARITVLTCFADLYCRGYCKEA
jgi:Ca2+-transporting ATPase